MVARTRFIITLYVYYLSFLENSKIRFYPTTGLTLLWARNPFGGNFNHWQVSRKEDGETWQTFEETFWIRETGTGQQVAQLHDRYVMMILASYKIGRGGHLL